MQWCQFCFSLIVIREVPWTKPCPSAHNSTRNIVVTQGEILTSKQCRLLLLPYSFLSVFHSRCSISFLCVFLSVLHYPRFGNLANLKPIYPRQLLLSIGAELALGLCVFPKCSVLTRRGQWHAAMCLLLASLPHSWPFYLPSVTVTLKFHLCQLSKVPVLSTFTKVRLTFAAATRFSTIGKMNCWLKFCTVTIICFVLYCEGSSSGQQSSNVRGFVLNLNKSEFLSCDIRFSLLLNVAIGC
jgi:hypothetical protein